MSGRRTLSTRRFSPKTLCSMVALATALAAGPACAQVAAPTLSFNAPDPTVVSGSVTWDRGVTTPGVETYTIDSDTAVLDFTPSDQNGTGVINFQNLDTRVNYQNGIYNNGFTVLNRIVPTDATRAIQFNGTVVSQIQQNSTTTTGGNVWFYSPGGIVIGTKAAFDVGSLFLTAADPTRGSGVISDITSFSGGGATGTAIVVQPGATLSVTQEGSYIALLAPRIAQGGTVRVNGSAAYVSAENATLTIDQGLFDIRIDEGSDGGLQHTGSTTGPASTGSGDNHGIYMVAVPKNTAISMLVGGGNIGFDEASDISIENGRVVLSAGYGLVGGEINENPPFEGTQPDASIAINSGNFTSSVNARAATDFRVQSLTATPQFTGDLIGRAGENAIVGSLNGATMTIGGALGSGLVDQSQKMTVAASAMAEKKTVGHRS